MDLRWKNLAGRMEEEDLEKYKVEESKREAFRGRGALPWNGGGCAGAQKNIYMYIYMCRISGEKIAGQEIFLVFRIQLAASAVQAGRSQQKKKR